MAVLVALATVLSTFGGGLFALRHQTRLNLILGFTAGVVLGVVAFDIFPEMYDLARSTGMPIKDPMVALVAAFLAFHAIEKWLLAHRERAEGDDHGRHQHHHPTVGLASALALSGHSFTDGIGIGLAFQVSHTVGFAVAIAVVGHDFADGLNTVSLMLTHGNTSRRALALLVVDALAPLAGAASTLLFHLPDQALLLYLGCFAGFLLYVGAADILPEAHARYPSLGALALTIVGAGAMYGIVGVLG